jgi:type I restriction enzyme S subunit
MSGALEARELLKKHTTAYLENVTSGIYHAGRESRQYVDDPEYGVPFLRSSDILLSDLSHLSYLSKKQVAQNSNFTIREGWSLLTRSGTIGRMAYTRKDMDGFSCSEDVLRVVPNEEEIKSGYLYAYLSSRFGIPLIVSGTYGAIIQHIEPEHIVNLPVPRLGEIEDRAHELVQQAADLRVEATQLLNNIKADLENEIGGGPIEWKYKHVQSYAIQVMPIDTSLRRLDAFHYVGYVGEAIEKAAVTLTEIGNYANALRPPILKRTKVDGTGIDFLGGRELLRLDQSAEDRISFSTPNLEQFIIKSGMVLFQCVGQRYGIFGTPILATRRIIGKAVTEAVMRLIPFDPEDAGYISIYLSTSFGQRLVMRHSAGTSIPVLQEDGATKILIYWPGKKRRFHIHEIASEAWEKRVQAIDLENEARALVERAIEEGGR